MQEINGSAEGIARISGQMKGLIEKFRV